MVGGDGSRGRVVRVGGVVHLKWQMKAEMLCSLVLDVWMCWMLDFRLITMIVELMKEKGLGARQGSARGWMEGGSFGLHRYKAEVLGTYSSTFS